jgi:hypothetical protein
LIRQALPSVFEGGTFVLDTNILLPQASLFGDGLAVLPCLAGQWLVFICFERKILLTAG